MMKGQVTLSTQDQQRAKALTRVIAGEWTVAEAATSLGLSSRQVRRLVQVYQAEGPAGVVHGNRGRRPAHALSEEVRAQVVRLARETYTGFNDQHLTEKLAAQEGIVVGRSTVQRLLRGAGQASPRTRRTPAHRGRRERMPQEGMLLQADGSRHRWLGSTRPFLTLVGGIDDATGTVPAALFREQEDAHGYLLWLEQVIRRQGIPQALYVDRHSIHERRTQDPLALAEEVVGTEGGRTTQFGRAVAELGITLIRAQSPQAKGRVERLWGTLQDRLSSELRLAGATTLTEAQAVLEDHLPIFNARFAVPAAVVGSAYRSVPEGVALASMLCFKYLRTVAADNTVTLGEHRLQLLPSRQRASYARVRVEVQEWLDGSLAVVYQGQTLAAQPAPPTAPQLRARNLARPQHVPPPSPPVPPSDTPSVTSSASGGAGGFGSRPPSDHPWRRGPVVMPRTKSQSS